MIDVNQLLILKRFTSSVTGPFFDLKRGHGHAAMLGKNLVASDGVASIESVYENTITAFAILQRLVWQQGSHTQCGVTRQYAQLAIQAGLAVTLFIDALAQLDGGFIAEGIADDHYNALATMPLQQGRYPTLIEIMLVRNARYFPVLQALFGLNAVAPGASELIEIPIRIALLDGLIELLQQLDVGALRGSEIMAVSRVKTVQLTLIGFVHRFGAGEVEACSVLVTLSKQVDSGRERRV